MGQYFLYNGELYHHGVKGMKWGVRKSNRKSLSERIGFKAHEDHKKAHKMRFVRSMSDKELAERNKRLGDEQKYRKLKQSTSKGKIAVNVILKTVGAATVAAGAVYVGKKVMPQLLSGRSGVSGSLGRSAISGLLRRG